MGFMEWLKSDTDENSSILLDPMGTGVGQGTKNPMDNSKDDSDSNKNEKQGSSGSKDTKAEDAKIEKQVQSVNEKMMKNQPLTPYVTLSIMGKSITSYTDKTSDCLVGLSVTKMGSQKKGFASSKVQIQLYDDKALEIEEIVSNALAKNTKSSKSTDNKKKDDKSDSSDSKKDNKKDSKDKKNNSAASNFTLQYGWMARGGGILAETPLMKGNITNYTISFAGSSIELNVEGTISGLYQASKVKTEEYKADVYGGKPSVIVQKIAKDEGWQIGGITETNPMIGEDGKPRSFVRKNQSATQFIVKELSEKATSTSGVVGYTFYFDTSGKMWFVPDTDSNEAKVVDSKGNSYGSVLYGTPIIGGAGSTDWTRSDGSTYSTSTSGGISYPEYRASASSTIKAGGSSSYKATSTSTSTTSGTGDLYIIGGTHIHKMDDAIQQNSHVKMYYEDTADEVYIQSVISSLPKDIASGSRICVLLDYAPDKIEDYITAIKSWVQEIPSNCSLVFITYPPIYDSKNSDSTISYDLISKYNDDMISKLPDTIEVVDVFNQLKDKVTSYSTDSTGKYYTTQVYQDFYNMIIASTYVSYSGSGSNHSSKSSKKDYSGVEELLKMGVSMSSLNGTVYQGIINDVLDDTIGNSSNSTDKTRKLITDVLTTVLTSSGSTGTPASTTTIQNLLDTKGIILNDTMNNSIVQRIQSLSTDATVLNMVPSISTNSLLGTSNILGTNVSNYIMNNSILNYEQKDSSIVTQGSDDKNAYVSEDPMGIGMGTDSGSNSSGNKSDSGSSSDGNDKTPGKKAHSVIGYYEYYTGKPDGVVISFSPEFKGNAIAGSKKAGKNLSVDSVRNEMLKCTVDGKDASNSDTGDDGSEYLVMGMSSSTYSDLEKASVSLWNRYHSSAVKASLEVLGNPFLEVGKYIKLAIFTKYGFMHHTSGEYLIKSIEDSISGGSYTSSLQLVKNEKNASKGKKGEGASRSPGSVSVPDGTYWQPQTSGINFDDAKPWMLDIANYLGEWFFSQTGHKLVINSVTTGSHSGGQYSHANGYKLDCSDWGGTEDPLSGGKLVTDDNEGVDESFQSSFIEYGREAGLGMNIEGSDDSNYHIDVQSMGYEWSTGEDHGGWPDAKSQEGDS